MCYVPSRRCHDAPFYHFPMLFLPPRSIMPHQPVFLFIPPVSSVAMQWAFSSISGHGIWKHIKMNEVCYMLCYELGPPVKKGQKTGTAPQAAKHELMCSVLQLWCLPRNCGSALECTARSDRPSGYCQHFTLYDGYMYCRSPATRGEFQVFLLHEQALHMCSLDPVLWTSSRMVICENCRLTGQFAHGHGIIFILPPVFRVVMMCDFCRVCGWPCYIIFSSCDFFFLFNLHFFLEKWPLTAECACMCISSRALDNIFPTA